MEKDRLSMKADSTASSSSKANLSVDAGINSLKGSGQLLPSSTRAFFEPRFGYDFSGVRVHADAASAEVANSINAKAFTRGRDLVFGPGHYSPDNHQGKSLLAHELAHVVQQAGGRQNRLSPALGQTVSEMPSEPTVMCQGGFVDWEGNPQTPVPGPEETAEAATGETTEEAPEEATETGPCGFENTCTEDRCSKIRPALSMAQDLVRQAKADLDPGRNGDPIPDRTRTALMYHFRADGTSIIRQVWDTFDAIERILGRGLAHFSCEDYQDHCTTILGIIPIVMGYTHRRESAPVVLCPTYFSDFLMSPLSRAVLIIHEVGHNTGLPRAPFERETYVHRHEYRALSTAEALATTDSYANFAHDNRHGAPVRVSMMTDVRTGLAMTGGQPQFMLSYGSTLEFRHPVLSIINPVIGIEFTFMPETGERGTQVLGSASIGARIAERGERAYLDLRTGGYIGREMGGGELGGILTEASVHFQPGQFDIGLFWRNYHSLIEGAENTTVIGLSAGGFFQGL